MQRKKEITLGELAKAIDGELVGDRNSTVNNICDVEEAGKGDLVFVFSKNAQGLLEKTRASASVVPAQ